MAEFKLSRLKYSWRGAWTAYGRYNPDDIVSYGSKVYVCLESHVAATDFYYDLDFYNNDIPPLLVPRWELMSDGTSWMGDWVHDTYYKRGDIISFGGTNYLCITAHVSPSNANVGTDGVANVDPRDPLGEHNFIESKVINGQLVTYWAVYFNGQYWTGDWTTSTYYRVNDTVRYGGKVYRCTSMHLSAASTANGLEANLENWTAVSISDDWKGDWTISTAYKLNDIVRYGATVYRCTTAHTSNSSATNGLPSDLSKWVTVHTSSLYRQEWTASVTYRVNDVVKFGSYLYTCTAFHNSGTAFDLTYWAIYCPGNQFDQQWNKLTVYQTGDIVRYGGDLYTAVTTNLGQTPSTAPGWQLLFEDTRIQGDWNQYTNYLPGDVVRRGGNVYVSFNDNYAQDPDIEGDLSSTNSPYWDLILPGSKWRGFWKAGNVYVVGEIVVYVASSYRCKDHHTSNLGNRPDDDKRGLYWEKVTDGNSYARLKKLGDLRTYGPDTSSTLGYKTLEAGAEGYVLQSYNGQPAWSTMFATDKVYYVAQTGTDGPANGTAPNSPWRTLRYALENVTGYATIFVRTGTFDEILPLRVPAFVSVVGDELRGTIIRPATAQIDSNYLQRILDAANYIKTIGAFIVQGITIGADDPINPTTRLYGTVPQNFTAGVSTANEGLIISSLGNTFYNRVKSYTSISVSGTNSFTQNALRVIAYNNMVNNAAFIKNEATLYINAVYEDSTVYTLPARWSNDLDRIISALTYDVGYIGNYKTLDAANYFINSSDYSQNQIQNMFLLRDGTGLRNMTLTGLNGTLGAPNAYLTRRPTAGAFASLDPGWGPSDTTAWVGTKSPYVQNVTTFGTGCIGLKIDGDIHGGGNQTIVSNDFTQILSDGIGIWANGTGRTEAVSVFTYYNHIGYLTTNGGKIRGTNGNCSYGTFGAVSEGFNTTETPITATVNNRYYQADVVQALTGPTGNILKLFYTDAGTNYSTANYAITGAGLNGSLYGDEIRDGAVYEVRVVTAGDSTQPGGSSYMFITNAAQTGDARTITIAGSDTNLLANYQGLRIILTGGTGAGQYGYVADYDSVGKLVIVGKESTATTTATATSTSLGGNLITLASVSGFTLNEPICFTGTLFGGPNITAQTIYYVKTIDSGNNQITVSLTSGGSVVSTASGTGRMTVHHVGWEHLTYGTPILSLLDKSSQYAIEPRVTFSAPGYSATSGSMPSSIQWSSIASNGTVYVATALGVNYAVYSADAVNWTNRTLPTTALWTKVRWVKDRFMAFGTNGAAAYSLDGIIWASMSMPVQSGPALGVQDWRDVAYGNGTWIAVATGGAQAAISSDGVTWGSVTLPEGAEWNAIAYGAGKFVTVAFGDSTTANTAYSTNGVSWQLGAISGGLKDITWGNGKFVAIAGGYVGASSFYTSLDGVSWTTSTVTGANWQAIAYGQGTYVAVATGGGTVAVSNDGYNWSYQNAPGGSAPWCAITFANVSKPGKFALLGGITTNTAALGFISTGIRAQARVKVVANKISAFYIWEPGSGYTSTPVLSITDPNRVNSVYVTIRTGNGALGNPTILNAGTGYVSTSTTIKVTGDGYKDQYQTGAFIVVSNLTRIPGPGDNVSIAGINDYTYKLLTCQILGGSVGNYTALLDIGKDVSYEESPDHGTGISIRQKYSQCRLTGHDFLDIGLGNFSQTNYPLTLYPNGTVLSPENEVQEANGGRVFYTSTDQDGNFRVGELFAVEQSTGIVTLNAQFFKLQGLSELRLGGVTVGGSGVVIREFSTDVTFTADSNNIVPTQKAIKGYLQRRVSGGGADAITGQITAGVVSVGGPNIITTTTGDQLIIPGKVNFKQGIDGTYLALAYWTSGGVQTGHK